MKKFLPLMIFIIVFSAAVISQVGIRLWTRAAGADNPVYRRYEDNFLRANYMTIDKKNIDVIKLEAPLVIYNFWASWCLPCLEEMPSMIELKKKYSDEQLQIIAINTDEENQLANIQRTMEKIQYKNEFIIIPDVGGKLVEEFKVSAIPLTIIFHNGRVVHFSNGPMDFSAGEFLEQVDRWIKN